MDAAEPESPPLWDAHSLLVALGGRLGGGRWLARRLSLGHPCWELPLCGLQNRHAARTLAGKEERDAVMGDVTNEMRVRSQNVRWNSVPFL